MRISDWSSDVCSSDLNTSPPFGGEVFTGLLLEAFLAMEKGKRGPRLIPDEQPLDLFVTVTDLAGHPELLSLNSPPRVMETEHRLVISFSGYGDRARPLGDIPGLLFAARATSSFPGAFPPFQVKELDRVLAAAGIKWPGRDAFLHRVFPRRKAAGLTAEDASLIDGSVLANAPFRPAIGALRNRPAHREVDRRFVYIDPKPGRRSVSLGSRDGQPGFFTTILKALSDLPRQMGWGLTAWAASLFDGAVLSNAHFCPAIGSLRNRPAHRGVDRLCVYIDPKPGRRSVSLGSLDGQPGFFNTILKALSDLPREQPIRDNLEAIEGMSRRIREMRRIVVGMQPEVDAAIERELGGTFFIDRPTPQRRENWRSEERRVGKECVSQCGSRWPPES